MLKRILKYNIGIGLILFFFFLLSTKVSAFTLLTDDQEFNIPAATLKAWQKPTNANLKFISLEPEKNADTFLLTELGLRNKTKMKSTFLEYNLAAIYTSLKDITSDINGEPEDAVFKTENGIVTEFNPGKNGRDLDTKSSISVLYTTDASDEEDSVDIGGGRII